MRFSFCFFIFALLSHSLECGAQRIYNKEDAPFNFEKLRVCSAGYVIEKQIRVKDSTGNYIDVTNIYFLNNDLTSKRTLVLDGKASIKFVDDKNIVIVTERVKKSYLTKPMWDFYTLDHKGDSINRFQAEFRYTSAPYSVPSVVLLENKEYLVCFHFHYHDKLYLLNNQGVEISENEISSATEQQTRNYSFSNLGKRTVRVVTGGYLKPKIDKYKNTVDHKPVIFSKEGVQFDTSVFVFPERVVVDLSKNGYAQDPVVSQIAYSGWSNKRNNNRTPYYWTESTNLSSVLYCGTYNYLENNLEVKTSLKLQGNLSYLFGERMENGNSIHVLVKKLRKKHPGKYEYSSKIKYEEIALVTTSPDNKLISSYYYTYSKGHFWEVYSNGLTGDNTFKFTTRHSDENEREVYCIWEFNENGVLVTQSENVKEKRIR